MQKKIPQLDALRGLAILVVILHNAGEKFPSFHFLRPFADGWMGVDLFFVLSGFLITGILLDTKQSESYFKNFYARRCLRIWPLYYSLLLFMFVVLPFLRPAEAHTIFEKSSPWWAFPLFLQNFLLPNSSLAAGPLGVTWSLAIEEQFYLAWPWVVRYCSPANLYRVAFAEFCLSPLLRFYLSFRHFDQYTNVFCRLDGLMAGALLAIAVRSQNFYPSKFIKPAWISFFIAAPLAIICEAYGLRWIVYSFSAAASVSLLYVSLFSAQNWLRVVMTNRFLVYTGTISYGLYLLHKIPFGVVESLHLDRYPVPALMTIFIASYVLATLSWYLLEKPFLRLKRFFEFQPVRPDSAARVYVLMP